MKAIITIIILLLIGLAVWLVVRDPEEVEIGDNSAAAVQALQVEEDAEIDLGEFQDKG